MKRKENALLTISHGSGAQFMAISVIGRELAAEYKQLYIVSHNKYFADMLALELPNVKSISYQELGPLYTSIMMNKGKWDVFNDWPYNVGSFVLREDNFYDTYRELVGLKRKNDWDETGSDTVPYLNTLPQDLITAAEDFNKQHPNFVLVQFAGGINPTTPVEQRKQSIMQPEQGLKRKYPLDKAEKLVEGLVAKGYEVVQYCLPEEPHVKGCIYLQQEQSQLFYYAISKYCKFVVCIDSSLMHLTIAQAPKVFAIWGQTQPIGFGYKKAINIIPDNYIPISPYFTGIPDTPYLDYPEPEVILERVENYLNDFN